MFRFLGVTLSHTINNNTMKKYVIKKKGVDVFVVTWNPIYNLFVTGAKGDAMTFTLLPIHVMKFYDKLNEFEIVEL